MQKTKEKEKEAANTRWTGECDGSQNAVEYHQA